MSFQGFVFEDDEKTDAKTLFHQMFDIDNLIIQTRFDKTKPNDIIIEEISALLDQRNKIYENIMKNRADELHNFVKSLNLHQIQIQPYYPVPTRCKFIVQNEQVQEAVDPKPEHAPNPWQKMLTKFVKKKESSKHKNVKSQLSSLEREHLKIVEARKTYLTEQLQNYPATRHLSPMDYAEKCRLESELESMTNLEEKKKK